jgi:hypothetical protein
MKLLRKTIMGVCALTCTAVTFTTATYAWWKNYLNATVQGLNITANSGLGFMVSVDGVNYKNDLTAEEILGAMLVRYSPNEFGFNPVDGKLYTKTAKPVFDENQNLTGYTYELDQPASTQTIADAIKNIELMPLTSLDGVGITDLYNSTATAESGRFIEFQVYFKTVGNRGEFKQATSVEAGKRYYSYTNPYYVPLSELSITLVDTLDTNGDQIPDEPDVSQYYYKENANDENEAYKTGLTHYNENFTYYKEFHHVIDITENAQNLLDDDKPIYEMTNGYMYEIYLNGEEQTSDALFNNGTLIQEATHISPTRFTSGSKTGHVGADMTIVRNGEVVTLHGPSDTQTEGDEFTVFGGNALRMSITDENAKTASQGATGTLIYELNDAVNGASNLGSYASTYSEEHAITDSDYSFEQDCLYGTRYSASYTYYTNLKQSDSLKNRLIAYSDLPTTIKDLTSKDDDGNFTYNKRITTLSSGEDGKLITFRIWLEGWDADCFDGLGGTIQSQLSFSSKRIN